MKKLLVIGGTSGIGRELAEILNKKYTIISLGSKNLDLSSSDSISKSFSEIGDFDYFLFLANYNYNSPFHKYSSNHIELQRQIEINLTGTLQLLTLVVDYFRRKGGGKIILTSSVTVDKKVFGTSVYSLAKAAYEDLVKNISLENAAKNITANCLSLGYMDAGLTYRIDEKIRENILKGIPMGRFGTIDEIANAVNFILNTDYLTGTTLKLHGGL